MKKVIRIAGSCLVVLFFSVCMFVCLVSGAPPEEGGLYRYLVFAALFSIGLPAFTALCLAYALRLQKKIEAMEENTGTLLDKKKIVP